MCTDYCWSMKARSIYHVYSVFNCIWMKLILYNRHPHIEREWTFKWKWDSWRSRKGNWVTQILVNPLTLAKTYTDLWLWNHTPNVQHKWSSIHPNTNRNTDYNSLHMQPSMAGLQSIKKRRYSQSNPVHHPSCPAVDQRTRVANWSFVSIFLLIKEFWKKKNISQFPQKTSSTTVFNSDYNKKCFLSGKSAY